MLGAKLLRPTLSAGRRMLSTELPLQAPIVKFGTAGRYANALYAAAAKKGDLMEVEADLQLFKNTISASPVLENFVANPSISRSAKVAGITSLMTQAKASETTKNALCALAEGGRLGDVAKVMTMYSDLLNAAKGEVTAIITSAKPLTAEESKKISQQLPGYLGADKKFVTKFEVDAALINGFTIEMGDKFVDHSVATQLKKLQALLSDSL
jgi:F-type H+-transporting ATPase subunit O